MADRYAPALFLEVLAFWSILRWLLPGLLVLFFGRVLVVMMVVGTLGTLGEHRLQSVLLGVEEIRCQDLDRRVRDLLLQRTDRRRVMTGSAVGDVVPVDRRHDDVLQVHLRGGVGEP